MGPLSRASARTMIDHLLVRRMDSPRDPGDGAAGRWRLVCLMMLVAFLALGVAAFSAGTLPGDVSVRQELLTGDHSPLRLLAGTVNHAGKWHVLLPATLVLFVMSAVARRRWWLWVAVLVGSGLIEHAFKFLVGRPRPSGAALGFPSG